MDYDKIKQISRSLPENIKQDLEKEASYQWKIIFVLYKLHMWNKGYVRLKTIIETIQSFYFWDRFTEKRCKSSFYSFKSIMLKRNRIKQRRYANNQYVYSIGIGGLKRYEEWRIFASPRDIKSIAIKSRYVDE